MLSANPVPGLHEGIRLAWKKTCKAPVDETSCRCGLMRIVTSTAFAPGSSV